MREQGRWAAQAGAASLRRGDSYGGELGGRADRKNYDLGKNYAPEHQHQLDLETATLSIIQSLYKIIYVI